jgi:hypothetical protein
MSIARILHLEALIFLYGLAGTVAYQMLTGRINVSGLLAQKMKVKRGRPNTSPERVQLLLATLAAASNYLGQVAHAPPGTLPDISYQWLYLMGGSSGIYALGKAWNTLKQKKSR